jgi:hypothetical protein
VVKKMIVEKHVPEECILSKLVIPRRQDKIKCLTTSKAQLYLFSTHSYHLFLVYAVVQVCGDLN